MAAGALVSSSWCNGCLYSVVCVCGLCISPCQRLLRVTTRGTCTCGRALLGTDHCRFWFWKVLRFRVAGSTLNPCCSFVPCHARTALGVCHRILLSVAVVLHYACLRLLPSLLAEAHACAPICSRILWVAAACLRPAVCLRLAAISGSSHFLPPFPLICSHTGSTVP